MENQNKPMNFAPLSKDSPPKVNTDKPAVKVRTKKKAQTKLLSDIIKTLENTEVIPISKGVSVALFKNKGVTVNSNTTLKDILEIEVKYPDAFIGLLPNLYEDFILNNTINPHVKVGDKVTIKRKYCVTDGDIPKKVTDLYLKALNDMTVIIAVLDNKDLALANTLEICK